MKKIVPIILIVLIISGIWFYTSSKKIPVNPDISSYRNTNLGISFKYPKILTVKGSNSSITIHHEVPFEHHDFCDFKGEATTTIKNLTDFNVELHIVSKGLVDTMKSESPYIPEENFLNNTVVPSPGFIDPVSYGDLKGFSIFEGAEGCGHTIYYLSINSNKTLVIVNDFITIFSGAIDTENMAKAEAVPGVINKAKAEEIFNKIVMTLVA